MPNNFKVWLQFRFPDSLMALASTILVHACCVETFTLFFLNSNVFYG